MKFGFSLRLLVVSMCNYVFGNILFAFIWSFTNRAAEYWEIAIVCTFISSVFSYQTQSRIILKNQIDAIINFKYSSFQLIGLAIAILIVPFISH